ncbi:uncharacterized protein LOC136026847 [Artemia franciscana]|uniref:uncharacterized protein LOC136026847 n=1 Tax=Artemia franciscana TaxID=6661 RepID=UPI0032D9D9EF
MEANHLALFLLVATASAIQHKIIVRRLPENVKPAVAVIEKETIAAVAEKRAAGEPILDRKIEGTEELKEGFVNSGVNSTEGHLRRKVVQAQTQLLSTSFQQGGISAPPGARQKEENTTKEVDKQWAALAGPALDLEGVNAATSLIYSALEAEACARRKLCELGRLIKNSQIRTSIGSFMKLITHKSFHHSLAIFIAAKSSKQQGCEDIFCTNWN